MIENVSESDFVESVPEIAVSLGALYGVAGTELGGAYTILSCPAGLSVPQVLWQSVPLTVSVQLVVGLLDGSFCTLAAKKTPEPPATALVILLWMVTTI